MEKRGQIVHTGRGIRFIAHQIDNAIKNMEKCVRSTELPLTIRRESVEKWVSESLCASRCLLDIAVLLEGNLIVDSMILNNDELLFVAISHAEHNFSQPIAVIKLMIYQLLPACKSSHRSRISIERASAWIELLIQVLADVRLCARPPGELPSCDGGKNSLLPIFELINVQTAWLAEETKTGFWVRPSLLKVGSNTTLVKAILRNLVLHAVMRTKEGRILVGARRSRERVVIAIWCSHGEESPNIIDDMYWKIAAKLATEAKTNVYHHESDRGFVTTVNF